MRDFYMRPWSLAEKVLLTAAAILSGMVIGSLFAAGNKDENCGNQEKGVCKKEKAEVGKPV